MAKKSMDDESDYEALLTDLGLGVVLSDSLSLASYQADCPWCGEMLEWVLDPSNVEAYVEDCFVCCRPCLVHPQLDEQAQVVGLRVECE